jgi:hypothetical protein
LLAAGLDTSRTESTLKDIYATAKDEDTRRSVWFTLALLGKDLVSAGEFLALRESRKILSPNG